MTITNNKALNGAVIIIIMEEPHTDHEDIILESRDSNNRPHREQNYGYQYAPSSRGNFRKRFGRGAWRGRSYTG